jgi:hypothetical protein
MPDEKAPTNPIADLVRNLQQLQSAAEQVPVEVTRGDVIAGDVELADGTKLRVRVVVSQVSKMVNVKGPGGRPLYVIETSVVPTVKEWRQ